MLKQMTGNNMVNDDFTPGFTREELIQVFEYFVKLVDNGVIPPFEEAVQYGTVYADQIPGWHDGTYAIFPTSASKIPSIEIVSEFDVAVSRYPVQDNPVNPGIITSPSMLLTINQNSKHIDEAAKFIDWFMNSEEAALIVKDVNGMPAVKPVADLLAEQGFVNPLIAEMVNITMPYAGFPENGPSLNQEVLDLLSEYINLLGFKEMNPEQTADNFIKDLTAKLEELKAQ